MTYDRNKKKAKVPDDESELVRRLQCVPDTESYLSEDGPKHRESFMTLLEVDKAARKKIMERNELYEFTSSGILCTNHTNCRDQLCVNLDTGELIQ